MSADTRDLVADHSDAMLRLSAAERPLAADPRDPFVEPGIALGSAAIKLLQSAVSLSVDMPICSGCSTMRSGN